MPHEASEPAQHRSTGHPSPGSSLGLLTSAAAVLAVAAVLWVIVRLADLIHHTLLLFALAALLAYALEPVIRWARGPAARRSRTQATLTVFGVLALLGVAAGVGLSKPLQHQVTAVSQNYATYDQELRTRLALTDLWLHDHGIHVSMVALLAHPSPAVKSWGELAASRSIEVVANIGRGIVEGTIVVLIAIYFLIYCEEMRNLARSSVPARLEPYLTHWQDDINRIVGGFVRGQLVLATTIGVLGAILCGLMGLRLWLLIGLFVTVAAFVPVVGPFVGAVPAVLAALASPHAHFPPIVRVIILIVCFAVINEVGSKILYPRLVGAALGLHEVLVLFVLLAGFEAGGIVGVLFAAPLTALGVVTGAQCYRFWKGLPAGSIALNPRPEQFKAETATEVVV